MVDGEVRTKRRSWRNCGGKVLDCTKENVLRKIWKEKEFKKKSEKDCDKIGLNESVKEIDLNKSVKDNVNKR